jgi:hypothetical protein
MINQSKYKKAHNNISAENAGQLSSIDENSKINSSLNSSEYISMARTPV